LKNGEHLFSLHVLPGKVPSRLRQGVPQRISPRAILFLLFFLAFACLRAARCSAQSTSDNTDTIRGVVINGVTREPISRALVFSPDNRFATLTNSEGRFEFTLPKVDQATEVSSDSNSPVSGRQPGVSNRPYMLMARKPGFLADPNKQNFQNEALQDLTLALIPEALIVGAVTLPTSEAPDSITLQIFRRQVQDGRAHWFPAGGTRSTSDGQFRFADLRTGTYKLLTHESLDRDPLTSDPRNVDPLTNDPRGPLFGYPPVYYQNAPDFESASTIQLAAGQTQTVNLSLVKQPYYRVKVQVIAPAIVPVNDAPLNGLTVDVYAHGRKGPGFSLGYNDLHHAIEGMLPNGTYTIEASGWGANGVTGSQTITIKGAPIDGPSMTLVPNVSLPVNVKEEFTSADNTGPTTWTINGRNTVIKGPRRYLNVSLEPDDDFARGQPRSLRDPTKPGDDALVVESVPAGSYWVRINSSRGYPASIRSGNLDLQHQPLVVGAGGAAPIEITMRDDTAEISGTVAGVTPPAQASANENDGARGWTSYTPMGGPAAAHIYCIPLADSSGQFTEIGVSPDGSFVSPGLAPGAYRLLAFDRPQPELEYRNPEAMQAYDSKGPVVRVAGGQKERVTLQPISTSDSGSEPGSEQ
jgi:hypothetical protein